MNCIYCQSKLFDQDRNCPQCGAPIKSIIIEEKIKKEKQITICTESLKSDNKGYAILSHKSINSNIFINSEDKYCSMIGYIPDYQNTKILVSKPDFLFTTIYSFEQ